MRVALINPPWMYKRLYTHGIYPPYGLLMVATLLQRDGHEVRVIDANALELDEAQIHAELLAMQPDAVGVTVFTDAFAFLERFGPWCKRALPQAKLLVGGPLVSGAPQTVMRHSLADFGAVNEGFISVPRLLRALEKRMPVDGIGGLWVRGSNGDLRHTGPTPTWEDLDTLPLPDWELLPVELYLQGGKTPFFKKRRLQRYLSTITTLGCAWACTFCQVPELYPGVRARSPQRVADEIALYRQRYAIDSMYFRDDILFRPGRIADALAQAVPGLRWSCLLRADMMTDGMLAKMAAGGCAEIRVGFESGDDHVLLLANKKTEVVDNRRCIEIARRHGVEVSGFLIVGLPGETEQSLAATEQFVREMRVRASVHFPLPLPGTPLYRDAVQSGLVPDEAALLRLFSEPQLPGSVLQPPPVNQCDLPADLLVHWAMRIAEAGQLADADGASPNAAGADCPF